MTTRQEIEAGEERLLRIAQMDVRSQINALAAVGLETIGVEDCLGAIERSRVAGRVNAVQAYRLRQRVMKLAQIIKSWEE